MLGIYFSEDGKIHSEEGILQLISIADDSTNHNFSIPFMLAERNARQDLHP